MAKCGSTRQFYWGVGYFGFQVTGMIGGFFLGLKFSIQGSQFLGRKIWQIFFSWLDLSRDFLGIDIYIDSFPAKPKRHQK